MSIIQTIRGRYGKLAGGIIALALIGFILMDAMSSGRLNSLFGKSTALAKVNGTEIDQKDYAKRMADMENLYKVFRKGQPITDEERQQIKNQVMNEMVMEQAVKNDVDQLGITVSKAEENDMFYSPNADPAVQQFPYFADQKTGQFNYQNVKAFEKQVKSDNRPEAQEVYQSWLALKEYVIRQRISQKYLNLVSGSVYTPNALTAFQNSTQSQNAAIRYVKIPVTSIDDKLVTTTDADLNNYMAKHAAQFFIAEPSRSIEYVSYDVVPNAEDTAKTLGELIKIKNDFIANSDNETFINRYSDDHYNNQFVSKKKMMSSFSDSLFNLGVGTVYGPYFEKGIYKLTKVVAHSSQPDSVSAQHILISIKEGVTDTMAHRLADSLLNLVRNGMSFDSLAIHYSEDGSKDNGGRLGYFTGGQMVTEFNDFCFENATGAMKAVKTQFGYHVIHILDQKNFQPVVKFATITKALNFSDKADQFFFAKANEFAGKNTTAEAFDESVKKQSINKKTAGMVKANDFQVNGLNGARELIRWMFEAKLGQVSNPIKVGTDHYVVAKLAGIQEKGLLALNSTNRPMIDNLVKNEKKIQLIADKYKNQTSIDALATAAGQSVEKIDTLNAASSMMGNSAYEPKVVGYAFNPKLNLNTVSPALKGRDAVYFIAVTNRFNTTNKQPAFVQAQMQQMKDQQLKKAIGQQLQDLILRKNNIKYYAQNIY